MITQNNYLFEPMSQNRVPNIKALIAVKYNLMVLYAGILQYTRFCFHKHIIERGPSAEINRNALVIPTLCGIIDSDKLADAFARVQHKEVDEWSNANIGVTLRMKRQEFMGNAQPDGYQKPGILKAC